MRMPTVTELYQAITTGTTLTVPNPNLKPEHADSYELAAQRKTDSGLLRVSFFQENISNALLSQSAPLVPGSNTLFSFVQNVDRTRARGIELIADQYDAFISGLELSGQPYRRGWPHRPRQRFCQCHEQAHPAAPGPARQCPGHLPAG